jgi:beta-lactamase regulating signal transducer with metallopeptidase domain
MIGPDWLSDPFLQRVSMALVHFLWQGVLVVAAYSLVVWLFNARRAQTRYALCLAAMSAMVVCPVVTVMLVDAPVSEAIVVAEVDQENLAGPGPHLLAGGPRFPLPEAEEMLATDAKGDWRTWIVSVWLVGVSLLTARLIVGLIGIGRLKRDAAALDDQWTRTVRRLCDRLNVLPDVFASTRVREAMAVGFFRPVVLIPASWLTQMSPDMLEAVIAHELAHIRRFDLWVNLLQRLVETVLFYHPAVWWLSQRMRVEREMCCDEMAVEVTQQRVAYASALEFVAQQRLATPPEVSLLVAGIGGHDMTLLNRVRNVLGTSDKTNRMGWMPVGMLVLAATLTIAFAVSAPAEEGERERERDRREVREDDERRDREIERRHTERREREHRERDEGARREGERQADAS